MMLNAAIRDRPGRAKASAMDRGGAGTCGRIRPAAGMAPGLERVGKNASRRSEEHTSELQSLMRISYAVFCLKKKKKKPNKFNIIMLNKNNNTDISNMTISNETRHNTNILEGDSRSTVL